MRNDKFSVILHSSGKNAYLVPRQVKMSQV